MAFNIVDLTQISDLDLEVSSSSGSRRNPTRTLEGVCPSQPKESSKKARLDDPISMFVDMGFKARIAEAAYKRAKGDVDATLGILLGTREDAVLTEEMTYNEQAVSSRKSMMNSKGKGRSSSKHSYQDNPINMFVAMGFKASIAEAAYKRARGDVDATMGILLGTTEDADSDEGMPCEDQETLSMNPKMNPKEYVKSMAAKGLMQNGKGPPHHPKESQKKEPPIPTQPLLSDEELLKIVSRCQEAIKEIELHLTELKAPPPAVSEEDQQALVAVYNDMIANFDHLSYHRKYGLRQQECGILSLRPKEPVPTYYANVGYESIYFRKVVSMQGLRNLIVFGREIFMELKEQLFASDPSKYQGLVGLNKMRTMTGNTVDLDTVVLRCNDPATLKTINAMNEKVGQKTFESVAEFAASQEVMQIAIEAAKPLLQGFIDEFKLSKSQQKARRVDPSMINRKQIPVEYHSSSRGKWPVWRYINCSVDTMHVNVPNMADIIGALLKAPIAAVRAYLMCKADQKKLDLFYEDGISDSCFNGKWKALESFNQALDKDGRISKVLESIQAANQHKFTASFFDADEDGKMEVEEMMKLASGKEGRDKAGNVRAITQEDVEQWVKDPAADI